MVSSVRQSQQAVVDAIGIWTKATDAVVPLKPAEVVDWYSEFARKLLDAQYEFGRNALDAVRPLFSRVAAPDGDFQRDLTGRRLGDLTVKDLDRLAAANDLDEYPQDATKTEKVAALEAAGVMALSAS
jgi:hypothetical protein